MWRSVAARASLHRRVSAKLCTNQSLKVYSDQISSITPCLSSLIVSNASISPNPSLFFYLSHYSTKDSSFEPTDGVVNDWVDQDLNSVTLESDFKSSSEVIFDDDDTVLISDETETLSETGNAQIEMNNSEVNGDVVAEYEIDNEKLESVLSLLQSSIDGSLESRLDGLDLPLQEEFTVKVLETPLIPGENLLGFYKWAMKKPDFLVTTRMVEALVHAICSGHKRKDAYAVWDLVKDIGENKNGVLKVEILNELISLLSRLGKGKAAFEVFNKFDDFMCVPNEDTYYFTIKALCRRSIYNWACSVSEKMLNAELLPDPEKIGKIISLLGKGRKGKEAHSVYLLAKNKNKYPPQSSINHLIRTLCKEDETVPLALKLLDDFSGDTKKHAIRPFSSIISALCRINDINEAKNLLFKMISHGPPPGNAVFNSVISGLSKNGDMEEAKKMMSKMENRGLKPDVYTYSVIMSGYVKGGQMDDACNILSEAKKKHSKLSPVTYHTLIRGYCKLEEFDKALELLAEMKDFGVNPNADEYNKLIQSLCLKALDWEKAEKLFDEMKENGVYLNGITHGLIRAVKELEEEEAVDDDKNEEIAEA